jgi:2-(1,2-epoxy-1,2-dihydrophenyl)acetyl-CoA isomerase
MTEGAVGDVIIARHSGVLTLTLNRPEQGNAIAPTDVAALLAAFRQAQDDPAVRCLIIGGAGKHFCTGGSVTGFARDLERSAEDRQTDFHQRLDRVAGLIEVIAAFDRPIIARVHGVVAGAGMMLALTADLVIGDESAAFMFAQRRVGLSPDGGISYFLPRIVGARAAARLVLTAARIEATEALALNLLTELVPADRLNARVAEIAADFAQAPQQAVKSAKALLARSQSSTLGEQLAAERDAIRLLVGTADFVEGVRAFTEKRPASFPSCGEPG